MVLLMKYIELKEEIREKLVTSEKLTDNSNLLKLGLNSLKVMRLVNKWRKKGIKVSYGELMQNPTLECWWNILKVKQKKEIHEEKMVLKNMTKVEYFKPFPLTDVQYAYKIGRMDGQELGGVACHAYLEFYGENVDAIKLEEAWNVLQYHHTMLRARFLDDGTQEIMDKPFSEYITVNDLRNCSNFSEELVKVREKLSHRKLKIEEGEVAGITLSLLPNAKTMIHFDLDLLVADVQSLQIILRDLSRAYMGKKLPEQSKEWSFSAYLERQKNAEKNEKEKSAIYWSKRLESMPFGPEIPLRKKPSEIKEVKVKRRIVNIKKDEWDILQKLAADNSATPAMLLLSAYAVILERWSKTKQFLINIPFFNRNTEYEGLEDVVADFTTLLLMEVDMRDKKTFIEVLNSIQEKIHEDMKYVSYSGVQIQRDLARIYGEKQNVAPFVFACNLGNPLLTKDFKDNLGNFHYMISQTPGVYLDFQVYESEEGLMMAWDAVEELFPENMIDDMLGSLEKLLHRLSKEDWNQYFDVLPEYQKRFIETEKNIKLTNKPACLHEAFLEKVKENPQKIAIIDTSNNVEVTYEELKNKAFVVASFIASRNIKKEAIAISVTRGYNQSIIALGILLSGNLYVPVSLNQPSERRKLIHERTKIRYVITDSRNFESVQWPKEAIVFKIEDIINENIVVTLPKIYPEDSAYIIMTSGTTGIPKGAEMYHKGVTNTITDVNNRFNITKDDSVLGVSSMDFDLSVYDLFGMLSCGGTMVIIAEDKSRDAEFWLEQILKYNITVWNSVPILLEMLLVQAESQNKRLPLRRVMVSGDWIGMDLPERVANVTENCKFIAMGGATEASIWSNYIEVKLPIPKEWRSIPYGRPLANQSYRVVDEKGREVPFLVEGELWIGGSGVGTYRGDDELAKKKFIKEKSIYWYRTGDKGRLWNDGTIEFLGREDFQVKIRGHRIELGEIEATLKSIKNINKVVVESSSDGIGDNHLIAYLETCENKEEPLYIKDDEIQERIQRKWNVLSSFNKEIQDKNEFDKVIRYGEYRACEAMLETLQLLGVFKEEEWYTLDEIIRKGSIALSQIKTIEQWVKALCEYKFIMNLENKYKLITSRSFAGVKGNYNKLDLYIDKLKPYLLDLLQGTKNPIEVYYAEDKNLSPSNLLDQVSAYEDTINIIIDGINKLIDESKEKVNILELGTRDIKITKRIVETIKNKNVQYTIADSSILFVNEAKDVIGSYPFVKFELLDLQKEDFMLKQKEKYQCVIAVNSIHRMEKLDKTLKNIRNLLAADGSLIMVELTIDTYLKDITATILEGGKRDKITFNAKEWESILRRNKFDKISVYPKDTTVGGMNIFTVMSKEGIYVLNEEYIKSFTKERLPEYMIPKVYYQLEKIPLSKNGKVDRKSLRKFSKIAIKDSKKEEPITATERKLCEIWKAVFKINDIGVLDNYYLLGGDSLIATRILTKVRDEFKVDFSIKDLMELKTIKEQGKRIDELLKVEVRKFNRGFKNITPDKENENKPFNLTDIQQAYWIGRSGVYDLGQVSSHCYFELDCDSVDMIKLQGAWNEMIKQHGMMRVVINSDGMQQILRDVPEYKIPIVSLKDVDSYIKESMLKNIRREMSHQVIETGTWPLFDVRATVIDQSKVRIHVSFDNLIFDGWSMFHLLHQWAERYRDEIDKIPSLEISFRDYVIALEKIKESETYEEDKKYWLERIEKFLLAPELPLAKSESEIINQEFKRRSYYLSENEWISLKNYAKKFGITPAVLLITAYADVLRRWSDNKDFTLNLTQFDRKPLHPEVTRLVGDFTTLTLLEINNSREKSFLSRAKKVQTQLMEDLDHSFYSAIEFERELKKKNGKGKSSIMPIVFTSGLGIDQWSEGKWIGKLVYNVSQTPQVWLDHQVVEYNGGLGLFWDSIDELFYPGMIDEMFKAYVELLKTLAKNDKRFIEETTTLVSLEISDLRNEGNNTKKSFDDKSLDQLFLDMEERFPEKIALVNKDIRVTYEELKEKSLYVCKRLREVNVEKEELVVILMKKSYKQVISVFGILFSGAAYLPLDIKNPKERLYKILIDSKAKNILVESEFLEENPWLKKWNCIVISGEEIEKDDSIIVRKDTDAMAYTIYTSGSTGTPKGVMISHKGAVNTILDINSRFNVNENDSAIALSNLNFDLSVYDIFGILGSGGKLVIPDSDDAKDPSCWIELMNNEGITIWNSVPTFVEMLIEYENNQNILVEKSLRLIMLSGDWIPISLSEKIRRIFDDVTLISMGGATEASIWSNIFEIPRKIPEEWISIPYGKPLANQQYYILDSMMQQCPDWVPGMLYISGIGLAKGYLNDLEKSNEKFIYSSEIGKRLYCTGDYGRYWNDGNIEFLGRRDNQIKINGYRVELGEIETAALNLDGISKAVALPITSLGSNSIVLFVESKCEFHKDRIYEKLKAMIPEYEVPRNIIEIDSIPLSENGKVNRKVLYQIWNVCSREQSEEIAMPNTELQEKLLSYFTKILGMNIGINKEFFASGGDSLKAIKLVNLLRKELNYDVSLRELYKYDTIEKLARFIDGQQKDFEEGML